MLRIALAGMLALTASSAATAQNMDIIRTDNLQNTLQLRIRNTQFVCAHPSLVWLVFPFEATPDYNYGYAQTCPTIFGRTPVIGNAVYNRILYRNANVVTSFFGNASNHTFQKAPPGIFNLVGPVEFWAAYNSSGLGQKNIIFNAAPTAVLSGPSANLSATLTTSTIGPALLPRYRVTGFFIDQNGINNVNLITPIGGISFATFLNVAPQNFSMPLARLNVPLGRLTQQPSRITSAFFKAYYELRLQ
jgi:hypothetical protein